MILTTTPSIEGHTIHEYLGIVSSISSNIRTSFSFKTQKNMNILSDIIDKAKNEAFENLKTKAIELNANAIVGISLDLETDAGSYFFVSITGTAVKTSFNSKKGNNY